MKNIYPFLIYFLIVIFAGSTQAQLVVNPDTWSFPPQQIGTQSEEAVFVIENQGTTTVNLSPEQISITSQNEQSISLSILTYNIWFDNQNWPARFAHMLSEIRELDPDIIGLQEVIQRANLDNQAQMMADSLGYYYYFSSVDAETSSQRFGNAILSRYPIEESNWKALLPLNDYRTVAHIRINVEGNVIDVYNTHLHNVAVNTHIREEQILDMLNFIDQTTNNEYIFVTGDYNANPDWEEMELMYEDFYDVYPVFHENHLDPEHSTLNYHLGHQQRRIDYIFFNKASASTLIPASAEVVIDEPDENGVYGSDHFGVFATFDFLSDADAFLLNTLDEAVELDPGESTQIGLIFAPFLTGEHLAFLSVADQQIPISGEGFDATIYEFPWEENFSNLDNGDVPLGWERNAENWGAFSSNNAGGEAPEMVFWWQPVQEGEFFVQTPLINTAGLDSMNLSFRNVIENFGDPGIYNLKVVTITGDQKHIIQQWINPASIPAEEITVQINSSDHGIGEDIIRIAWIFEGATDNITRWAIDDVVLSAEPALYIDPGSFIFDPQEINSESEIKTFTLTNIGGGVLTISPDDISINGEDQEEFQLFNFTEDVELGNLESTEIGISFFPQSEGMKTAFLSVLEHNIPFEGIAYDPTIYELPWVEDFGSLTGGGIPLGWTRSTINWGAFNSNNAGGEAPEMVFWWQPESSGQFYLTSPQIITTGLDSLVLSFKYRVNNFGGPGNYTLKVIAIANDAEYLIHQWVDPESIPASEFVTIIDSQNHGVGSESFYLAWVFDGITDNITQWDIDDIHLMEIGDSPIPEVTPVSWEFGQQSIESTSDPVEFTIRNIGGGTLSVSPDDIEITGNDANSFILGNIDSPVDLGPFETATVTVAFAPVTTGEKSAVLSILDLQVPLSGIGTEPTDYFIYSDFSIPGFTNVEGFREVPGWAQGITATDMAGEGEFGGAVLKLEYDLNMVNDFTSYWMWAFPSANISGHDKMVIYVKADEPTSNVRIQMFDTDGIQGTDGASYTYLDIGTEWQGITLPVDDFFNLDWANNLPDMSKIQRIDITLEKGSTVPTLNTIYVDMVGFISQVSSETGLSHPLSLQLYPNPASKKVTLFTLEEVTITIIDINGKELLTQKSQQDKTILDISGLKSGIYMVRIQNHTGTEVKKLLVQ